MPNPNLEILQIAVRQLGILVDELVFVGGCTTGLFITDEGAAEVRTTDDVDTIIEATSYVQYLKFSERLESIGFSIDTREDAPLCRWVKEETVLDVMPLDEKTLGFTNTWYRPAVDAAKQHEILPGVLIRVVTPPYFCATKLEAFAGRGKDDFLASHDMEDLITVIDGRVEITDEIRRAPDDVQYYVASKISELLQNRKFLDALPGYLLPDSASQGRMKILVDRLTQIAQSSSQN